MPTPVRSSEHPADDSHDSSSITAVRLVAIAITALLISFIVIDRTSGALSAGAATPPSDIGAGSIALTDDDGDRSLFDVGDLLPGRPTTNCIRVAYDGTAFDGVVGFRARGGGDLAPLVDITVEVGDGGDFGDCDGFEPADTLYRGTLASLVSEHGEDGEAIPAMTIRSVHQVRTFRVTMAVRDDTAAAGRIASVEFRWSVST